MLKHLLFFLLIAGAARATPVLRYTVSMEHPGLHAFHVVLHARGLEGSVTDLTMPAWMPGYYQLLDYAKKLVHFHAVDGGGRELGWEKTTANTWRVEHRPAAEVTVEYDIVADRNFVAQPWLDSTRGYIAPAGVFLYVEGGLHWPVVVEVRPLQGWTVATGLEPAAGAGSTYIASDFDILYDSPILAGALEELSSFLVQGRVHRFFAYRPGDFDRERFLQDLKKVVEAGVAVIGDIPYRSYTFLAIGPGR